MEQLQNVQMEETSPVLHVLMAIYLPVPMELLGLKRERVVLTAINLLVLMELKNLLVMMEISLYVLMELS